MPKHTKTDVKRIENDIRSLRDSGKSDREIRALLGLELRTFQNYNRRIHESDKEVWFNITRNELETEFLKLRSSLEDSYLKAKEISENSKDVGEILEALDHKDNCRVNIIMLIIEGAQLQQKVRIGIEGKALPHYEKHTSLLTK